jgi:uncharacterized LabA/DUF88 family protein
MIRTLLVVDIQNLFCGCRDTHGRTARVDYRQLLAAAAPEDGHDKVIARAYLVGKRQQDDSAFIGVLERFGYTVRKRMLEQQGSDWDTGIVVETMRDEAAFDRFVLASGDGDFESLLQQLQVSGKETVVMAFRNCLNARLAMTANKVIHLDHADFVWKGDSNGR